MSNLIHVWIFTIIPPFLKCQQLAFSTFTWSSTHRSTLSTIYFSYQEKSISWVPQISFLGCPKWQLKIMVVTKNETRILATCNHIGREDWMYLQVVACLHFNGIKTNDTSCCCMARLMSVLYFLVLLLYCYMYSAELTQVILQKKIHYFFITRKV